MKVLLPLDGSPFAEAAIAATRQFTRSPDTELHLLTVIEPHWSQTLASEGAGPAAMAWRRVEDEDGVTPGGLSPNIEKLAGRYLDDVSREFPECSVRPVLRVGPYPAQQIAAYAESHGIDVVVMATHGRTGISRLLRGSVAAEVVRAGVAPVVLVRPDATLSVAQGWATSPR